MSKFKKFLGFMMAALMVFALTPMTAFADQGKPMLRITDTDGKNHSYQVFQVLKGDVSGLTGTGIDKNTDIQGILANAVEGSSLKEDVTKDKVAEAVAGKTGAEIGTAVWELVDQNKPINLTGEVNWATGVQLDQGYYLVKDVTDSIDKGDAASRFIVALVGDLTVTPKKDAPTIDKKITNEGVVEGSNGKVSTAAIGDTVDFDIAATVPDMDGYSYYFFVVRDTLSDGLTLRPETIKVYFDENTVPIASDLYTKEADEYSFIVAFKNIKTIPGIDSVEKVHVKYSATLNDNAKIGTDANTNTVFLEYSNNPNNAGSGKPNGIPGEGDVTGVTPESITKTYAAQISLTKVDGETGAILDGATFKLEGEKLNRVILIASSEYQVADNGTWYKLKDGTYTQTAPVTEGDKQTADKYESLTVKYKLVTSLKTESDEATNHAIEATVVNGHLVFKGLNAGDYTLTEIEAPTGYNKITKEMHFTISAALTDSIESNEYGVAWAIESPDESIEFTGDAGLFSTTIENNKGLELPSTGGIGTTLFYVGGGILVLGAVVYLVTRRRAKSSK